MNKQRRTDLSNLQDRIERVKAKLDLSELADEINDLKECVETIRDEEQEYYDNMPESFQYGEKGEAASEAVSQMENAISELDEIIEALQSLDADKLQNAFDYIEEAKGS